jgi:DNA primase
MSLSPQWLDELRARITLSAVIGRTTRLTKAGHEFKACCPFHSEKSPSFTVNDSKGFYHCFGCGAHGDAIRWMTDQRGMGFMDAVKELAAEAGLEVPAPDPRAAQAAEQRDTLHDVMAAAQQWFAGNLAGPEGEKARAYLATRGFDAHTVSRFGFGYAPDGRQAMKAALGQFPEAQLIEAGLRISVDDKEPYDRFRSRLMLPIEDARGRVIAFGGRILDAGKTDAPKYLNSPDTPLFDKGRTLYNLHRAGPVSRQSGRLIVVEGYMDVIALAAAGIGDAVAPLGTALTERQIEMLWRLVESPLLCFDGDAAGQRAAMRAVTRALPLLRPAHSLSIVRLPAGMDPDDLIKRDGAAAMERVLSESTSLVDTLWQNERDAASLVTPEDKAGLKARLMAHVETIGDRDIQSLYRRDLLKRFSEFAFPARDWSKHKNVVDIAQARSWAATQARGRAPFGTGTLFIGGSSPELAAKHAKPDDRDRHLHRRLGAAITAGLLHYPEYSMIYADTLARVHDLDPRLDLIAEATFECESLDAAFLAHLITKKGEPLPQPIEWDNLRFPFAWPPTDDLTAAQGLEKAIRLYAGRQQIEVALKQATERLSEFFSDENWQEQQRLLRRQTEFKLETRQVYRDAA